MWGNRYIKFMSSLYQLSFLCKLPFCCISAAFQLRIIYTPSLNQHCIFPMSVSYQFNISPIPTISHLHFSSSSPNHPCISPMPDAGQLYTLSKSASYQPHFTSVSNPHYLQTSFLSASCQLHISCTQSPNQLRISPM